MDTFNFLLFFLFYAHDLSPYQSTTGNLEASYRPSSFDGSRANRMANMYRPNTLKTPQTGRHRRTHQPIPLGVSPRMAVIPTSVHRSTYSLETDIQNNTCHMLNGIDKEPLDLSEGSSCCTAFASHRSSRVPLHGRGFHPAAAATD